MNVKDFLRPDWRKMILLFLLSLFFFSVFWGLFNTSFMITLVAYPFSHLYNILINPNLALTNFVGAKLLSVTLLTIDRFYYYFLSCLIFWIYDKLRKK